MHKFVLGAVLCASLGLPANSAELLSGEKTASVKHQGMRLACHWVAKERTLRLLNDTAIRVHKTGAHEVKVSPVVPARTVAVAPAGSVRVEPTQLGRPIERIALMVGTAY
jgi:hypothetical protein